MAATQQQRPVKTPHKCHQGPLGVIDTQQVHTHARTHTLTQSFTYSLAKYIPTALFIRLVCYGFVCRYICKRCMPGSKHLSLGSHPRQTFVCMTLWWCRGKTPSNFSHRKRCETRNYLLIIILSLFGDPKLNTYARMRVHPITYRNRPSATNHIA